MKQIIALGGGGFSMEPENPLLDDYILAQTKVRNPKVCFLPTASGDSVDYIQRFYHAFASKACEPSHLSLFKPPTRDLEAYILDKNIIYVGGGNTKNLMILWKEWGIDQALMKAWHNGVILTGLSAGSICWFEEGVTDSYGDRLEPINGLGLLKGSHCPHYDGEEERRPAYRRLIEEKKVKPGIAADDGVALHYIDQDLQKIVSSRKDAFCYDVDIEASKSIETQVNARFLGE